MKTSSWIVLGGAILVGGCNAEEVTETNIVSLNSVILDANAMDMGIESNAASEPYLPHDSEISSPPSNDQEIVIPKPKT